MPDEVVGIRSATILWPRGLRHRSGCLRLSEERLFPRPNPTVVEDTRASIEMSDVMRVQLFDRRTHETVAAEITAMTDRDVEVLNATWMPAFQQRYERQEQDEDFLMWNTGKGYLDLVFHREELQSFVLIADDIVQGVLLLESVPLMSRLEPDRSLVYVRYLATAPWNRRNKIGPGWFRGVGTLLLAHAVQESRDLGCDGRLGLHSLRGSDEFYQRQGLDNLGLDAARRGLTYFELRS